MPGVEIFLGSALVDGTEKAFLSSLEHDLSRLGAPVRVLANLELGSDCRQVDFVIVTSGRVVQCELKSFRHPVIARETGPWRAVVPGSSPRAMRSNPFRQARDATYALSDAMREFACRESVPPAPRGDYHASMDTVVCVYRAIPPGSTLVTHPVVKVVGYDELLALLASPGSPFPWSESDWDAFILDLGLQRQGEDAEAARDRAELLASVYDYRRRYLNRTRMLAPRVPLRVIADGGDTPQVEPDVVEVLRAEAVLVITGRSGSGKSHLARHVAAAFADAGHVPIWLDVHAYEGSLDALLRRAIAPHTTLPVADLLARVREAGSALAIVVDALESCSAPRQEQLLGELSALRLACDAGLLITTQQMPVLPEPLSGAQLELVPPDADETATLLRAYDAEQLVGHVEALTTPFELSMAAECASDAGELPTRAELLDLYIRRVAETEPVRAGLRHVAWRIHDEFRGSLQTKDVLRSLQREGSSSPEVAELVLSSRLLVVRQGLVTYLQRQAAARVPASSALPYGRPTPRRRPAPMLLHATSRGRDVGTAAGADG